MSEDTRQHGNDHGLPLAGKVALVTADAGAGIGKATAFLLARAGADVVVTDLHAGRTARVADELGEMSGRRTLGLALDVTDEERVGAVVTQVCEQWGGVDVLVNNAGPFRTRARLGNHDRVLAPRCRCHPDRHVPDNQGGAPVHDGARWRVDRQHRLH
jgi:NAD(P)-dependent dehydrogenase (short-subunit alcohol dehydrogenase family)